MKFTIFGADGFIGSACVSHLRTRGHDVVAVSRGSLLPQGEALGHVIYAIGVTADFRQKPFETADAHVSTLAQLLKNSRFDSWLYLSSTRVYGNTTMHQLAQETLPVTVYPNADGLYDISKLMGESLCLSQPSPAIRVARLSNVYGESQNSQNFLSSVLQDVKQKGAVTINEAPESSKDYIALADIVTLLESIATSGQKRIYNVASGRPVSHQELADALARLGNYRVTFTHGAPQRTFPTIDNTAVRAEFSYAPRLLLDDLADLL